MATKPIRIAHVIGKLNAAGVEAVVNNYYRNINHDKYQFDYFIDADSTCQPLQELIDMGARYYVVPPYQRLPQYLLTLMKYFKENHYKIVHSGMNTLSVFPLFAAWLAKVPVRINHNHSTSAKGEIKKNFFKYLLKPFSRLFATHCCACSRFAGEWLFGKKMVECGKVRIFNNAIDFEKFAFDSSVRNEIRKALGIDNKFVVGHVGRFCFQKNQLFLIDVFKEVYERDNNAILLLIGIGELEDEVRNKVLSLDLQNKVIFLGARTDVNRFYQAMDVFVFPSRYEGLGLVGIEAQAAGLPCVFSSNIPDEAVITKNTKVLSLEKNINIWAQFIINSKGLRRVNTKQEIINSGFDIKIEAKKMEEYYDSIIEC